MARYNGKGAESAEQQRTREQGEAVTREVEAAIEAGDFETAGWAVEKDDGGDED